MLFTSLIRAWSFKSNEFEMLKPQGERDRNSREREERVLPGEVRERKTRVKMKFPTSTSLNTSYA